VVVLRVQAKNITPRCQFTRTGVDVAFQNNKPGLQDYKRHMGWRFPWVSSLGSDFRYDFGAAFTEEQRINGADYNFRHVDEPEPQKEGMSVFALQSGAVHHTYSTYARGVEALMGTYHFLDLAPWGRNEEGLKFRQAWWRRHDEYERV